LNSHSAYKGGASTSVFQQMLELPTRALCTWKNP